MGNKWANLVIGTISVFLSTSCIDNEKNFYISLPKDRYFNFDMNQNVNLKINYGFPKGDYIVLFDLYDEYPLVETEDGQLNKKDIEPIYRAATDGSGFFSANNVQLPATISEVWLYSDYIGTTSPVKLKVEGNTINFDLENYTKELLQRKQTRAVTSNNHIYPDGWLTLGNWSDSGSPEYLMPDLSLPSSSTMYAINETFIKYPSKNEPLSLQERHPEFFEQHKQSSDVNIIKSTKVFLSYINSTAAFNNVVGYFTYPTGQPPTDASQIQKILAFPSTNHITKTSSSSGMNIGSLVTGSEVQLKYWDGEKFNDEFPEGVSIGWWLETDAFTPNAGNIKTKTTRYSLLNLNSDNIQRTVSIRDRVSDRIVAIAFEDNVDKRYNDATFYLRIEQEGAIDPDIPMLPDIDPPSNVDNFVTYYGTLTIEDLWPSMGDYDMNDMIVDYNCKVYKYIVNNKVYKVVDEFTPRHNGASFTNGFGYQYHQLSNSAIKNVEIAVEGDIKSRYMENQKLEPGQTHPTIILFDDLNIALKKKFTVTVGFNDVDESLVKPPYNPFLIAQSDLERGKEVHLVKYPPTDKVENSYFGMNGDGSRPNEGLYYVVSRWIMQYPFALNLPNVKDFPTPEETVPIDKSYPLFRTWIESNGTTNKDWYKKPAK